MKVNALKIRTTLILPLCSSKKIEKLKSDKNTIAEEKRVELEKYKELVIATIDYHILNKLIQLKTTDFDSDQYFEGLKEQALEHFDKGRLSKLKQWFRDLTEMQIETRDFGFNQYLREKTDYDINIFQSFKKKLEKVIDKGKITTDNQFHDINMFVDQLSQTEPLDNQRIAKLNNLLLDYEQRKIKKSRQHNIL